MRVYDQGCFYRVTCDEWDVRNFARSWPCSGLRCNPISFTFDKRNGDIVDHTAKEDEDGSALLALSQDAQKYGRIRLRLQ